MTTRTAQLDAGAVALASADRQDESARIHKEVLDEADRYGVSAVMETFDGDPADALIKVAESTQADLVVVGNRGMSGMKRFVLGSVLNRVAHHCPCNLLIVNTDAS